MKIQILGEENYYDIAVFYYLQKKYDKALEYFLKKPQIVPDIDVYYTYVVNCFFEQKKYKECIDFLTGLSPKYVNLFAMQIAQSYYCCRDEEGRWDSKSALKYYLKVSNMETGFYSNVADCYFELLEYDSAIVWYKKSLALGENTYLSIRGCGLSFYGKGYYKEAISVLSKLEEINWEDNNKFRATTYNNLYDFYFCLAQCYDKIQDYFKSLREANKFVYFSYINGYRIKGSDELSDIFFKNSQPLNSLTILDIQKERLFKEVDFINFLNDIRWYTKNFSIDTFKDSYLQIKDFLFVLKHNIDRGTISDKDSFVALLYFYLGGIVKSYQMYDEELDKVDSPLSAKDCYYYVRCTDFVNVEREIVIANCIKECPMETSEDLYYKGLLLLMKDDEKQALILFEQSKEFKYSKYLLDYFNKKESFIKGTIEKKLSLDIDILKEQIIEFSHLKECDYVTFKSKIVLMPDELWEYFYIDKEKWEIAQQKLEIEILMSKLMNGLGRYFEKKIVEQVNLNKNIEYIIANNIEEKFLENKFFLDLLLLYYTTKELNIEQCFSLFCYFTKYVEEEKQKKIEALLKDGITNLSGEIFDKILEMPVSTTINALGMLTSFIEIRFENGFQRWVAMLKSKDGYVDFRNNLWKYISYEKETMKPKQFENKYFFLKM